MKHSALWTAALCILWSISGFCREPEGCMVSAKISTTKSSYIYGEPIELALTLTNSGSGSTRIPVYYPTFWSGDHRGVVLTEERTQTPSATEARQGAGNDDLDVQIPFRTLDSRATWTFDIYLQSYLRQPLVGPHRVRYEIDLPCTGKQGEPAGLVVQDGPNELVFQVIAGPPGGIEGIIRAYDSRLQAALRPEVRLTEPAFWEVKAIEEALTLIENDAVVPELGKLVQVGRAQNALRALRRFPHNPEAEKILLESIRSKDPQRQQDAVLVLNAWSYVIAESDLQVLLTSPLPSVRVFALRNAKSSRNVAYLPLVSKYASDPDSWVASEAKQAAEALRSIRQ